MSESDISQVLCFLERAENLKNTLRNTYTSTGRHESSAEHTWRLCLMLVLFDGEVAGMDRLRLLYMAIIHDLAEAVCGDIPAIFQNGTNDKALLEKEAMREILKDLPVERRDFLFALWQEYETSETPEARFLKGLDKLETILQHNQGCNPCDFDYVFNLHYGQEHMGVHPLLSELRRQLDTVTRMRIVPPLGSGSEL